MCPPCQLHSKVSELHSGVMGFNYWVFFKGEKPMCQSCEHCAVQCCLMCFTHLSHWRQRRAREMCADQGPVLKEKPMCQPLGPTANARYCTTILPILISVNHWGPDALQHYTATMPNSNLNNKMQCNVFLQSAAQCLAVHFKEEKNAMFKCYNVAM